MACKVCGATKQQVEFYDSINTFCKVHWRERVKENRDSKIDYYREFDRNRANLPHRLENTKRVTAKWKADHPDRRRAQVILGNAVRDGKIVPLHCWVCGNKAEAHHTDYADPLGVMWLCPAHHKQAHALGKKIDKQESMKL